MTRSFRLPTMGTIAKRARFRKQTKQEWRPGEISLMQLPATMPAPADALTPRAQR